MAGMLKNHHLAQAIGDVGFDEFRRQLSYKAAWYGCQVLVASRWEPTSKTCSSCGWVDEDSDSGRPDVSLLEERLSSGFGPRSERGAQFSKTGREFFGQSKCLWRGRALARASRLW